MPLPPENPTYTKIDDSTFYLSKTASEQISVAAIKSFIVNLQNQTTDLMAKLQSAASVGVADAQQAINDLKIL